MPPAPIVLSHVHLTLVLRLVVNLWSRYHVDLFGWAQAVFILVLFVHDFIR